MMCGFAAKFPCYSAATARNSAAGRLTQFASKLLIYKRFLFGEEAFWAVERVFPLSAGEMPVRSVMAAA
jgi:hypothetical protein